MDLSHKSSAHGFRKVAVISICMLAWLTGQRCLMLAGATAEVTIHAEHS
jgi:hypothetical protein